MAPATISAPILISFPPQPFAHFLKATGPSRRSPTDATSYLTNVFDGFLSGSHLIVEVEHILFRQ
jgi:hypothetical protein